MKVKTAEQRAARTRRVVRRLGDDPEWNALVDRLEAAEAKLADWEETIAAADNINEEDLRWWLGNVLERLSGDAAPTGERQEP